MANLIAAMNENYTPTQNVLMRLIGLIQVLPPSRQVFTTGRNSAQIEYDGQCKEYVEVEVFDNHYVFLHMEGNEIILEVEETSIDKIVQLVGDALKQFKVEYCEWCDPELDEDCRYLESDGTLSLLVCPFEDYLEGKFCPNCGRKLGNG